MEDRMEYQSCELLGRFLDGNATSEDMASIRTGGVFRPNRVWRRVGEPRPCGFVTRIGRVVGERRPCDAVVASPQLPLRRAALGMVAEDGVEPVTEEAEKSNVVRLPDWESRKPSSHVIIGNWNAPIAMAGFLGDDEDEDEDDVDVVGPDKDDRK